MMQRRHALTSIVIALAFASCATVEKPEIAALALQQLGWTKSAYHRAKPRLERVTVGMSESKFLSEINLHVLETGGSVIGLISNGLIFQAREHVEHERVGLLRTYVFGYVGVDNLLHEKVIVVVKDNTVLAKIPLEADQRDNTPSMAVDFQWFTTKDVYLKALDHVKNVRVGMWSGELRRAMRMFAIWTGQNVNRGEVIRSAAGQFDLFGPGYLYNLYSQEKTDEGLHQKLVFGYMEEAPKPGFAIHMVNLQVSKVEYLSESESVRE